MNPRFLYGTAWKEERTAALVTAALAAGFRAIDTANQRKHYFEAAVGEAVRRALDGGLDRDALFLQTKFTFQPGQDHRLPYDPRAPIGEQVAQSMASSLDHLGVSWVDSYVLHGPSRRIGLGPDDLAAWGAMEVEHDAGRARALGVSNVSAEQLDLLCRNARVKPSFAQIRTYARNAWEDDLRDVCARHGVAFQGFSLLTANPHVWRGAAADIAASRGVTSAQVLYAFARQLGMIPMTGTSDPKHMAEALASLALTLTDAELARLAA